MKFYKRNVFIFLILALFGLNFASIFRVAGSPNSIKEAPFQIVLIDTCDDSITDAFKSIIRTDIKISKEILVKSGDLFSIANKIPSSSVLILLGHGSTEGLKVNQVNVPWEHVSLFLDQISPYQVFLASCDANKLEELYQGIIISLPYNPDVEVLAWWMRYRLLMTENEIMKKNGLFDELQYKLERKDKKLVNFIHEKVNKRNKEIKKDRTMFKCLGIYEDLDSALGSDSDGYPIDFWAYKENYYSGWSSTGDYVTDGTAGNEGWNAINIIFSGITSSGVYNLLWQELGWSNFMDVFSDNNYLRGTSGPISHTGNTGAFGWSFDPYFALYWRHMRFWDLGNGIIVGQVHKTVADLFGQDHRWGLFEESEDIVRNALHLAYVEPQIQVSAVEHFPLHPKHIGRTNCPDDWDIYKSNKEGGYLDYQNGFAVEVRTYGVSDYFDPDGDGYSSTDELNIYKTDPWVPLISELFLDFEDESTLGWTVHPMTQASNPMFDVVTYNGPTPYPSGTKRARIYMQDSYGDKNVVFRWDAIPYTVWYHEPPHEHRYYSYYTERSNSYMLAYHDFYPSLSDDGEHYIKVRFYNRYLQVYMYEGEYEILMYQEDVYPHDGWWGYEWQLVEIHFWYDPLHEDFRLQIARKADGAQYNSPILYLGAPEHLFIHQAAIGFRGGWHSGNYGYAYWDNIRVSETSGLLL